MFLLLLTIEKVIFENSFHCWEKELCIYYEYVMKILIYPVNYITKHFPLKRIVFRELNNSGITDKHYRHVQRGQNESNLGEYHKLEIKICIKSLMYCYYLMFFKLLEKISKKRSCTCKFDCCSITFMDVSNEKKLK